MLSFLRSNLTSAMADATLTYDFAVVAEAELFAWVDCPDEIKEEKIEAIRVACQQELPKLKDYLLAESEENEVITSQDLKQVRFPIFKVTREILSGRETNLEIKVRINPCLAINYKDDDTHHSKIWVIVSILDDLDISGKEFAKSIVNNISELINEIFTQIRPCYLKVIDGDHSEEPVYKVSIKQATISEPITGKFGDLFLNLKSEKEARDRLKEEGTMLSSLCDIIRIQNQQDEVIEDPLEALQFENGEQTWHVSKEETAYEKVYRMVVNDERIDVSGLVMVGEDSDTLKKQYLYNSFLPLALRFSWAL